MWNAFATKHDIEQEGSYLPRTIDPSPTQIIFSIQIEFYVLIILHQRNHLFARLLQTEIALPIELKMALLDQKNGGRTFFRISSTC